MDASEVGLVGVGILGRAVAEALLEEGVALVVRDVRPEAVAGLAGQGAGVAGSVAEVAGRCAVVLVLVQTEDQCRQVVGELVAAPARPRTVAVMSTIHPDTVAELAAVAAGAGVELLDAPLAGKGVESVQDRSIQMLVGGDDAVVARLRPVLAHLGEVVPTGPLGSAAALKLAHNVLVYVGYQGVVEAVELARVSGVRDGLLGEVTERSGTLSPQMRIFHDIRERRRLDPGDAAEQASFRVYADVLEKDCRLAAELAERHGLELPATRILATRGDETYAVAPSEG